MAALCWGLLPPVLKHLKKKISPFCQSECWHHCCMSYSPLCMLGFKWIMKPLHHCVRDNNNFKQWFDILESTDFLAKTHWYFSCICHFIIILSLTLRLVEGKADSQEVTKICRPVPKPLTYLLATLWRCGIHRFIYVSELGLLKWQMSINAYQKCMFLYTFCNMTKTVCLI